MGKLGLSFSSLYTIIIEILDKHQSNTIFIHIMNVISLILYFFQILSYFARLQYVFYDSKLSFLLSLFYYSNFSNFLVWFQSDYIWVAFYVFVLLFVGFCFFYPLILNILKIWFHFKIKKNGFIREMNVLFTLFFTYFSWFLVVPFIEILTNPLRECEKNASFCADNLSFIHYIISIIGMTMLVIFGLIQLHVQNNYKFLDFDEISLKLHWFSISIFAIRCSLPILFTTSKNEYLFYFLMHTFAIFSFLHYIKNFPIRSPYVNSVYISLIFGFEAIIMIFTFWRFFNLLIEESLFYAIIIGFVFSFKLGFSVSNFKKKSIYLSNFNSKEFLAYSLEELYNFINKSKKSLESMLLMLGMLNFHAKNCNKPECDLNSKAMKNFENLKEKEKNSIIQAFILQRFQKEVETQYKNKLNIDETLLLKYIGFLIFEDDNTWRTYYEAQRIKLLYQNPSFLGEIVLKNELKKIRRKILEIEKEKGIVEKQKSKKILNTNAFFRIYREKKSLEVQMTNLLKHKIEYLNAYKVGFDGYDNLLKNLASLCKEINFFRKNLKEISALSIEQNQKIVNLRISSMLNCLILNKIPETLANEDEIESIKKKCAYLEKDVLSPKVFLKENVVVCDASFLNSGGRIIESSKTESLAKFFGYELQDLKLVESIEVFMPEFIAKHHQKMVFWGFNKIRKEKQMRQTNEIFSYAIDKEGFIFPVKIYLGFNFKYHEDYVVSAGILKIQEKDNGLEELILDEKGMVVGFNRKLFNFFHNEFSSIKKKSLMAICLYSLCPKIKELLKNEQIRKDRNTFVYRDYACSLIIPINFLKILEFIEFNMMETLDEKNYAAQNEKSAYKSSYNTARSFNNTYDQNNICLKKQSSYFGYQSKDVHMRLNQFLQNNNILKISEDQITDILQDSDNSIENLINKFIETGKNKKFQIIVDISSNYHRYGKNYQDALIITRLLFSKISLEKTEQQIENMSFSDQSSNNIIFPTNNNYFNFEKIVTDNSVKIEMPIINFKQNIDFIKRLPNEEEKNTLQNSKNLKEDKQKKKKKEENQNIDLISSEIIKRKTSQISYSDEVEKKIDGYKKTAKQERLKEMDLHASQPSSTKSINKKAFNILAIINILIERTPKSIFYLSYIIIFQFILIICYSITYYLLAGQYVTHSYLPLKTSLIDQLKMNQGIAISTTIFTEFENIQKGYSNITDFQYNQLNVILNRSYEKVVRNFYHDRNREKLEIDSHYLKNTYMYYTDYRRHEVKSMLFSDVTDVFINIINTILKEGGFDNHEDILNAQQRNYIWYLITTKIIRDEIQSQFESSDDIVTNNLFLVMIFAIAFIVFCKMTELFFLTKFYEKITRILNIFLRYSSKEANQEVIFLNEILNNFNNKTKSYMSIDFSDLILNKKNPNLAIDNLSTNTNNLKKINKDKNTSKDKQTLSRKNRNFSFMGLKPFSKLKIVVFLFLTSTSAALYISFNYYLWINCNSQIEKLLSTTDIFNNLYIYSATDITFNNLLIREQIMRDPLYEATNEKFQIHENRLVQLQYLLSSRMQVIEDGLKVLPEFSSIAETELSNELFTKLMKSNICEVLIIRGYIENQEKEFCSNAFDQSFQLGIYSALNAYINVLKSFNYLTNMSLVITEEDRVKRVEDIKKFINSTSYVDTILSSVLINDSLGIIYDYFSEYYLQELHNNINRLISFIWIMCALCLVFIGTVFILVWRFLRNMYSYAITSFCLIPIEKLNVDEQTIFLIKNLYKDYL